MGNLPNTRKGFGHDFLEPLIDFVFGPKETAKVLHPFKIGYSHAASVCQYVWHNNNTAFAQRIIGGGRGRSVCAFDDNTGFDLRHVLERDLFFECRRNQEFGFDAPEILFVDHAGFGVGGHIGVVLHKLEQIVWVDTVAVKNCAADILNGDNFCAVIKKNSRTGIADIAKALHCDSRPSDR